MPIAAVVRGMIDQAYEVSQQPDRLRAAQHLAQLTVEDVPDPEILSRQLEGTCESDALS